MDSWKKRWIQELDGKIPKLSEEVRNAPIYASAEEQPTKKRFSFRDWVLAHKRRFYGVIATASAAVATLTIVLPIALQSTPGTSSSGESGVLPIVNTASVMLLEINPKAVFSVDKEGVVTDVVALNQDADVIISDTARTAEMEGKTAQQAMQTFVDYAAKLGYLNLNAQSAIRVTEYENETASVQVTDIGASLETYFKTMGAQIVVVQDTLSGEEFCQRAGIENSDQGTDGVAQSLSALPALYSEREAVEQSPTDASGWGELFNQTLSIKDFFKWIWSIKDIISNGFDLELLPGLSSDPQTFEEYMSKMQVYLTGRFAGLQAMHKNIYEDAREEISDSDYQAYLDGLIEEHGSLSAYWESLQK